MNCEINRLKSFTAWPVEFIDVNILARIGCYYKNKPNPDYIDIVICFFCDATLCNWKIGECPLKKHESALKQGVVCPLLNEYPGYGCNNIPINKIHLQYTIWQYRYPSINKFITSSPICSKFKNPHNRMISFKHININILLTQQLVKFGFFFNENDELIKCYHCGLAYKNYNIDGDTIVEYHIVKSSTCGFLLTKFGVDLIYNTLRRLMIKNNDGPKNMVNNSCKVCFANECDSIADCGHIVMCSGCIKKVSKCVICTHPICNVKKIYFS